MMLCEAYLQANRDDYSTWLRVRKACWACAESAAVRTWYGHTTEIVLESKGENIILIEGNESDFSRY